MKTPRNTPSRLIRLTVLTGSLVLAAWLPAACGSGTPASAAGPVGAAPAGSAAAAAGTAAVADPRPSPSPTASPTPQPAPTATVKAKATHKATAKPTHKAAPKPTHKPTPKPTHKPTPKPNPTKHGIVPGAFCSDADHGHYGYAANGHLYRCSLYASDTWHWKRV